MKSGATFPASPTRSTAAPKMSSQHVRALSGKQVKSYYGGVAERLNATVLKFALTCSLNVKSPFN